MLVFELERLVDRLWFLEAPVADGIEYDTAQTYLFGNAESHENSFADKLLAVAPCGKHGFTQFKVSVDQLMTCIMQGTNVPVVVFGKTFDVKVQFSPSDQTITLSDIVFSWEVGQHQEFAVTVVLAAWTACVKRGDCIFLKFSGPSLHIIRNILQLDNPDDSNFISLALGDASVQGDFTEIKKNVVFRQDTGDLFLLDETHSCFKSESFAVHLVPAWYASDFANMLYTIHTRISASCSEISLRISSIYVLISYKNNCVTLDIIEVRPCAQRLGLARCVLWRLIRSCHLKGISKLVVSCAVPATQQLCKKMGFSVGEVSDECADCEIMWGETAAFMEPASCGLESIIPEKAIAWPEFYNLVLADSSELNDQAALNKRMHGHRTPGKQ